VVGVRIIKSSGNPAFDLSAEQAVKKVDSFVEIKDMPSRIFEAQFRRFTLRFSPEDKL
jgi:colicin import membrane protein